MGWYTLANNESNIEINLLLVYQSKQQLCTKLIHGSFVTQNEMCITVKFNYLNNPFFILIDQLLLSTNNLAEFNF